MSSHASAPVTTSLLTILCLALVHRDRPDWLAIGVGDAARAAALSPERVSRLASRVARPFADVVDTFTRRGRPTRIDDPVRAELVRQGDSSGSRTSRSARLHTTSVTRSPFVRFQRKCRPDWRSKALLERFDPRRNGGSAAGLSGAGRAAPSRDRVTCGSGPTDSSRTTRAAQRLVTGDDAIGVRGSRLRPRRGRCSRPARAFRATRRRRAILVSPCGEGLRSTTSLVRVSTGAGERASSMGVASSGIPACR
jgi:hypothetical protein